MMSSIAYHFFKFESFLFSPQACHITVLQKMVMCITFQSQFYVLYFFIYII